MSKISIIVPIYKNQDNIIPFYKDFTDNIKPFIDDYEIVMVHDASPDDSWTIMKELSQLDKKVKLIKLSRNFGAIAASFTGIQYSEGDCVTVKACDLQEPPELTVKMYKMWKAGSKSVIAIREARNDPWYTTIFANMYYWLMRKMVVSDMPKGGFDTYLIDRKIANKIVSFNDRNSPITLQILWMGFGPDKTYYERKKREIGRSSWTFSKKMKLFVDSLIGFSYIPIRFMSGIGLFFSVSSFLWGVYMIIVRILGKVPVQGYTTILVLMLFSSGLIMFTLGLLGEYVWRTLDASRRRPISVVEDMVNIGDINEENTDYRR